MDPIEQALRIKQNEYETLQVELANCNAQRLALEAQVGELLVAIGWLEGYFYANIDGGGNHGCPWCYGHDDQKAWCDMKHSPDCVIGKALASQPELPLIEEVREKVTFFRNALIQVRDRQNCNVSHEDLTQAIRLHDQLLARLNPAK